MSNNITRIIQVNYKDNIWDIRGITETFIHKGFTHSIGWLMEHNAVIKKIKSGSRNWSIGDSFYLRTKAGNAKIIQFVVNEGIITVVTDFNTPQNTILAKNLPNIQEEEVQNPVVGVVTPKIKIYNNKQIIEQNAWVTCDKWNNVGNGIKPLFQVRKVKGDLVYFTGYTDRVSNPIGILRLATQEELDTLPGGKNAKQLNVVEQKEIIKEITKNVVTPLDKKLLKATIDKCRKQNFDEEEHIYEFLINEIK